MLRQGMRLLRSTLQIAAIVVLIGGALLALTSANPANSAAPREASLQKGAGVLDGLMFTAMIGPQGKDPDVRDVMFFKEGQFLSLECEDRCNYPASAYYAREIEGGHEFMVEAWCPTKESTMVWRGRIVDGEISGTVAWSVRRFYWTVGTTLTFDGDVATEEEAANWRT